MDFNLCPGCETEIPYHSQVCSTCARKGSLIPPSKYCIACQSVIINQRCKCDSNQNNKVIKEKEKVSKLQPLG